MDFQRFAISARRNRDQQGPLTVLDFMLARGSGQLVFQIPHMAAKIQVEFARAARGKAFGRVTFGIGGGQKRDMDESGKTVVQDGDAHHGIQTQHSEIGQVVCAEPFVGEVCVHTAKPTQAPSSGSQSPPVRQFDAARIADHDMLDVSAASDQHADLSPDIAA